MNIPGPFTLEDVTLTNTPESSLILNNVAGFAELLYGPNATLAAGASTGLANDATVYSADVTVDGVVVPVAVTGSTAQTFATLITQINTDLGVAATAALSGNRIVITSATTGSASTVEVADTTATGLFGSVRGKYFGLVANHSTVGYSAYLRWSRMLEEEQTAVTAALTLYNPSAVAWTQGVDFINIAGTGIVPGSPTGLSLTTTYQVQVDVNGAGNVTLSVPGRFAQTYQQLVAVLANAAFGTAAVSWSQFNATNGRVVFTSPTYGTTSTVALTAGMANDLIAALTNGPFTATNGVAVPGVNGTAGVLITAGTSIIDFGAAVAGGDATGLRNDATVYTMSVVFGTQIVPVSVVGSAAQTFTTLATEIQTDLAAGIAGSTCAVSGGDLLITAGALAPAGFIRVVDSNLLGSLRLFGVVKPVRATVAVYEDVLRFYPQNPAEAVWNTVGTKAHLEVPAKPYALGGAVRTGVFFDNATGDWTHWLNDTAVSPIVNPPETPTNP